MKGLRGIVLPDKQSNLLRTAVNVGWTKCYSGPNFAMSHSARECTLKYRVRTFLRCALEIKVLIIVLSSCQFKQHMAKAKRAAKGVR